jgi:hypothetical protein
LAGPGPLAPGGAGAPGGRDPHPGLCQRGWPLHPRP